MRFILDSNSLLPLRSLVSILQTGAKKYIGNPLSKLMHKGTNNLSFIATILAHFALKSTCFLQSLCNPNICRSKAHGPDTDVDVVIERLLLCILHCFAMLPSG